MSRRHYTTAETAAVAQRYPNERTDDIAHDPENPMDLDRAGKIADVAREITSSAKAEVDFIRATGQNTATKFFPRPALPAANTTPKNLR